MNPNDNTLAHRIAQDLLDSYDEEYELELEDRVLDAASDKATNLTWADAKDSRRLYFRELFRMQAELVKLQDWVVKSGQKVVI